MIHAARSPAPVGGTAAEILNGSNRLSPLAGALEKRSGKDFLSTLHNSIEAQGLSPDDALAVLNEVVNSPDLAVQRTVPQSRNQQILQAVIVTTGAEHDAHLVTVEAEVQPTKPPAVDPGTTTATIRPVDLTNPDDLIAVARQFEGLRPKYAVREVTPPPGGDRLRGAFLGDPAMSGYRDVPPGWEEQVTTLAAVFGITMHVVRTPAAARAQSRPQAVDVAIAVNGSAKWADVLKSVEESGAVLLNAGQPGTPFADLLSDVRRTLLDHGLEGLRSTPQQRQRELAPGEIVYHRKVGGSGPRSPYDLFDEGSTKPCTHKGKFTRFSRADKAVKGLRRLYSNLDPSMVWHCPAFPNCGLYKVERPARE